MKHTPADYPGGPGSRWGILRGVSGRGAPPISVPAWTPCDLAPLLPPLCPYGALHRHDGRVSPTLPFPIIWPAASPPQLGGSACALTPSRARRAVVQDALEHMFPRLQAGYSARRSSLLLLQNRPETKVSETVASHGSTRSTVPGSISGDWERLAAQLAKLPSSDLHATGGSSALRIELDS